MSAGFTPGPWEASGDGVWAISPWNARFRLASVATPSPMNGVDWQANASLIASAPDLLSQLERACAALQRLGFAYQVAEIPELPGVRAAIAKAKGGVTMTQTAKQLSPDPEGTNGDRAGWAATALKAFQGETGCDDEDALGDLLANLMHFADRENYDFDAALDRARGHYEAETGGRCDA